LVSVSLELYPILHANIMTMIDVSAPSGRKAQWMGVAEFIIGPAEAVGFIHLTRRIARVASAAHCTGRVLGARVLRWQH